MTKLLKRLLLVLSGVIVLNSSLAGTVSQDPLYLVVSADPNVLFNMSIETPMGGAAYNDQPDGDCAGRGWDADGEDGITGDEERIGYCYDPAEEYLGYFDSDKCYSYSSNQFNPDGASNADHSCSNKYSGNFMNWATMTAMDMFIYTLTGGNRVVDTTSETVVERAQAHTNTNWFPFKTVKSTLNVSPSSVTPFSDSTLYLTSTTSGDLKEVRIGTSIGGNEKGTYNLRVKVCDSTEGLEGNCVGYNSNSYFKPEGLIQKNADHMRYAVTSYLKDNSKTRDGGVLRAQMKYVGPTMPDGSSGTITNPYAEINTDGTFVDNPDGVSIGNGVDNSGVINYINKFSDYGYKGADPAAELFYESIRYYKNLGPTAEYSNNLTDSMKGGFPVLTSWNDPVQYSCQKNFIVGINDANPWLDKRLPGTHFTSSNFGLPSHTLRDGDYGEPSTPDSDIDVTALTNKVGELEGLNGTSQIVGCTATNCDMQNTPKNIPGLGEVFGTKPGPGKENSYYIAGLAYYANTQDIRDDFDDEQNISSFLIDTQEYKENPLTGQMNMLWLAGKYGGFTDVNDNDEPDLQDEWDADSDGEPDNYVLASSPQKMVAALSQAFDDIEERTSSASAVATNSTRLDTNSKIYQARFTSTDWSGNLQAYSLNDYSGAVEQQIWDAADLIPSSRNIYTYASSGVEFQWSNLTSDQQTALGSSQILDYLRGSRTGEGTTYRARDGVLGDIINSDPLFSSDDEFGYYSLEIVGTDVTYSTYMSGTSYSTQKGVRQDMLYVGANDGMLHAFLGAGDTSASCNPNSSACEGEEVFAYIPKAVYSNLASLASLAYDHAYFVDNSPQHGDAYIDFDGSGVDRWGTALVGTLGGGGKGVFALDISDPLSFTASDVLWDLDDSDLTTLDGSNTDLGYTFSEPMIVKLANGKWGVIFGNGYNSESGKAVLYIRDLVDGSEIKTIDTEADGANGLSSPIVVDTNGDNIADYVYAGDLKGNLWKFDISDSSITKWGVAFKSGNTPKPLFTACEASSCTSSNGQPITSQPQVVQGGDGLVVLFGTGKYFETGDNLTTSPVNSFYGIFDTGSVVSGRSALLEQSILAEVFASVSGLNYDVRITTDHAVDYSAHDGWYIDFDSSDYTGERVVANSLVRSGRVIFPTLVPDTAACTYGGTSWLMEIDALSGSRLTVSPFDLNDDGSVNDTDAVRYDSNGDGVIDSNDDAVFVSGKKSNVGIIREPAVISKGNEELKYTSGSSGDIEVTTESSGDVLGRQSWLQIR